MKTNIIGIIVFSLGLLYAFCSRNAMQQNNEKNIGTVQDTTETFSMKNIDFSLATDLYRKQKDTLALTKAEKACADKVNDLAFMMLHQMSKDQTDSSFVVSPMSLNCAIAMTGNGASGKTLQEIEQLVGPIADANSFFKKYYASLPHNDYSNCGIYNYLAVNSKYPINEEFTNKIETVYDACVKSIDFTHPQGAKQINDWFCLKLQEESQNVAIKPDSQTSLFLANVLDFRAFWASPFNSQFTYNKEFTNDNGQVLEVPMMYCQERTCIYTENGSFQAVSLPYLGCCYRMLFVLPKNEKLSTFTNTMTSNSFLNILSSLKRTTVTLRLPRFRCVCDMGVKKMLTKTISSAFDVKKANFNAICSLPTWIDEISQNTSIEVTEQGTKARSITVESFLTKSESFDPEFIATHPFLYFVYDEVTQAILFAGQFCGNGAI